MGSGSRVYGFRVSGSRFQSLLVRWGLRLGFVRLLPISYGLKFALRCLGLWGLMFGDFMGLSLRL